MENLQARVPSCAEATWIWNGTTNPDWALAGPAGPGCCGYMETQAVWGAPVGNAEITFTNVHTETRPKNDHLIDGDILFSSTHGAILCRDNMQIPHVKKSRGPNYRGKFVPWTKWPTKCGCAVEQSRYTDRQKTTQRDREMKKKNTGAIRKFILCYPAAGLTSSLLHNGV